ncbi:hypothetical protein KCP75_24640 [Salmonella enterica subsp. enterica]|nr:hypothetical protein KCP75_24640 [Salmonella enterica subsp. enterica]
MAICRIRHRRVATRVRMNAGWSTTPTLAAGAAIKILVLLTRLTASLHARALPGRRSSHNSPAGIAVIANVIANIGVAFP